MELKLLAKSEHIEVYQVEDSHSITIRNLKDGTDFIVPINDFFRIKKVVDKVIRGLLR